MILQGFSKLPSGREKEFLRDSVENVNFYSKNELEVTYKGGETETFFADDNTVHTMYLLNNEGKTLKVLWRQPVPERNPNPVQPITRKKRKVIEDGIDMY